MKKYPGFYPAYLQKILVCSVLVTIIFSAISNGSPLYHNGYLTPGVDTVPAKHPDASQPGNDGGLVITSLSGGAIIKTIEHPAAGFPGGSQAWTMYLMKTLRYPQEAVNKNIQGQVTVKFTVDEKGRIKNPEALTGAKELQKEAVRVVKESGRWIPAEENGEKIQSEKEQVIIFKLESELPEAPKSAVSNDTTLRKNVEVTIEAAFPGGSSEWMRFLNRTFRYPESAQRWGIKGTVVAQFIVDVDGSVSNVEAISGPTQGGLREEVTRIIKKSGKWEPAIHNGAPVKSYKKQSITFMLESN